MPNISDRLREARETLGLSQQALAEKCGITARSQRNYESGERSPDAAYLAAFAGLGADVTYVLTGERASDWERDVLKRTAAVVATMEPSHDGPIGVKMMEAYKSPAKKKARNSKFSDLEAILDRCSEDDLALVMGLAMRLALKEIVK